MVVSPPPAPPAAPGQPPSYGEATANSTSTWQEDLQALFNHAKDRFADVVWDLADEKSGKKEEIWGHKAIIYARAPPSFQAQYFHFKPPPPASPMPLSYSPGPSGPSQSMLSLSLGVDFPSSRTPSPYEPTSPYPASTSTPGAPLRITSSMLPVLFSKELEYLYTGKGFGEAFEFLFNSKKSLETEDTEESRLDKLRKDLVFMWRSRLYSDVRIMLTNDSTDEEESAAVFSSHRFVLVSRSPYFYSQLVTFNTKPTPGEPLTLRLPSPPFTPASLHFSLGFIYTGTLNFSNRTFDLDTAFHLMRSATYLSLPTLYEELQARIVQEMLHGLFHAFLEFPEYERITGSKWGMGGCKCRQCARRAPRVLMAAVSEDIKNPFLEKGARRALVGLFGEGWCNPDFAQLPQKTKDGLMKGLAKRTIPLNIFPLLFAAHAAMNKLNDILEAWADTVREMVLAARKTIDDVLAAQSEACFEQSEWMEMMEADGGRFDDAEKVEWIMESIKRGLGEKNAPTVYQTLVSSILIRPHPTEPELTMLTPTSHIRIQVEQTKVDVLRWLRKFWIKTRQEHGFDEIEAWALKEISHEIDVPIEDLLNPVIPTPAPKPSISRLSRADGMEAASVHSLRTSLLNRNAAKQSLNEDNLKKLASSASSVRSSQSTLSVASRLTVQTASPSVRRTAVTDVKANIRPTVSTRSLAPEQPPTSPTAGPSRPKSRGESVALSLRGPVKRTTQGIRPRSSAPSVASARSQASTVRKISGAQSTLRVTNATSRPTSVASNRSEASTTFKTAPESSGTRSRRVSTVSTRSVTSTATSVPSVPRITPTISVAAPTGSASTSASGVRRPERAAADVGATKALVVTKRSTSAASVRSVGSTLSKKPVLKVTKTQSKDTTSTPTAATKEKAKGKENQVVVESIVDASTNGVKKNEDFMEDEPPLKTHEKTSSVASEPSTIRRKRSNDTITMSSIAPTPSMAETESTVNSMDISSSPQSSQGPASPRGATLDIGIPCIITSKRKRFRAFARYIGELEGEYGPWVGVEVPISENSGWADERTVDAPQWNDGSWGGIKYFDVGANSQMWGDDDWSISRRRGTGATSSSDWASGNGSGSWVRGMKRDGDQLSVERSMTRSVKRIRSVSPAGSDVSNNAEYRGLFVRPQQVLYVVHATGPDY